MTPTKLKPSNLESSPLAQYQMGFSLLSFVADEDEDEDEKRVAESVIEDDGDMFYTPNKCDE